MAVDVTVYDETGEILRCVSVFLKADAKIQAKEGESWLLGKSDPERDRVVNGRVMRRPANELEVIDRARAETELRKTRNALLRRDIDAINPIRWETMDETQRAAWREYYQALLDLPETTTDPRRPVWPARPE